MEKSDLTEFEIEQEGLKLRICRGSKHAAPVVSHAVHHPMPMATQNEGAPAATKKEDPNVVFIKSPMVGTFYRSSSPEAASFVKEGDKVSINKVVCIIEAMKIMNEINAEVDGTILEVLVENGHTVEFGQPLFKVSKS